MLGHIDPMDCPCSVFACTSTYEVSEVMGVDGKEEEVKGILEAVCSWPTFHGDLREYNANQTYKKVILGALREDGSKTREGFSVQAANKVLNKESVFNNVFSRARDVASFLYEGLKERVYNNEDVIVIGKMRRILDLKSSMKRLEIHGAARISNLEWRQFKDSAVFFEQDILTRVDEDELRTQYREFNRRYKLDSYRLSVNLDLYRLETLNLIKPVPGAELDNCSILGMFLDPQKPDLYRYEVLYLKEGKCVIILCIQCISSVTSRDFITVAIWSSHCLAPVGCTWELNYEYNDIY